MNKFCLTGEDGQVCLSIDYLSCGPEGCDCRGTVTLSSWSLRAEGKAWFTTADLVRFAGALRTCCEKLEGEARFATHRENLTLQVIFDRTNGSLTIQGTFRETPADGNELRFHIHADQSFIGIDSSTVKLGATPA